MKDINSQFDIWKKFARRPTDGGYSQPRPQPSAAQQPRRPAPAPEPQNRRTYKRVYSVRMPQTKRRPHTRNVVTQPESYMCMACGKAYTYDRYPGSWIPKLCKVPDERCKAIQAERSRQQNKERQARYRAAHKKA